MDRPQCIYFVIGNTGFLLRFRHFRHPAISGKSGQIGSGNILAGFPDLAGFCGYEHSCSARGLFTAKTIDSLWLVVVTVL